MTLLYYTTITAGGYRALPYCSALHHG